MVLAVAYENGEVFEHFGHAKQFKLYNISNGQIHGSDVVDVMVSGHEELVALLTTYEVAGVICGSIGDGAVQALMDARIMVYTNVSGNADEVVAAWLRGELVYSQSANCFHHETQAEEHSCGGCAGCHGCC